MYVYKICSPRIDWSRVVMSNIGQLVTCISTLVDQMSSRVRVRVRVRVSDKFSIWWLWIFLHNICYHCHSSEICQLSVGHATSWLYPVLSAKYVVSGNLYFYACFLFCLNFYVMNGFYVLLQTTAKNAATSAIVAHCGYQPNDVVFLRQRDRQQRRRWCGRSATETPTHPR